MTPFGTAQALAIKYGGGCAHWRKGQVVRHSQGYDVRITGGCYLDSTYGRVSNFWHWERVDNGEKGHGYGWDA